MKVDLADKESLEQKRAQHEEEAREKCKLISEQKAVSVSSSFQISRNYFNIKQNDCVFLSEDNQRHGQ